MSALPFMPVIIATAIACTVPAFAQAIDIPGANNRPQLFYEPPVLSYQPPKLVFEPPQVRQPVIGRDCDPSQRDRTRPCVKEAPKRAQSREEGRGSVRQPGR
jgi:hypothetical protein